MIEKNILFTVSTIIHVLQFIFIQWWIVIDSLHIHKQMTSL